MTTKNNPQHKHIFDRLDKLVKTYQADHEDGEEVQLRDLLCDLMHYANAKGIDFDHELSMATDFFSDEQEEEL